MSKCSKKDEKCCDYALSSPSSFHYVGQTIIWLLVRRMSAARRQIHFFSSYFYYLDGQGALLYFGMQLPGRKKHQIIPDPASSIHSASQNDNVKTEF